ncbi:MAG TPA: 3'-5' exonuclease [Bacteroidia bacterium]|nr:3'-5' exonuclease [Bacteroidia bacterium]HNU33055.1 3'-5' exonuclease [Bacteroidia bacterium]
MNWNYIEQLNEPQQQAVQHIKGPAMIIAGAGSGKTRVLTYRIVHLMQHGVDPFNILSLTFTNKAAREMKNRIAEIVGDEARNLWMGTFHSVFARILRVESEKIGYPSSFTIYDTDDAKSLIKKIIAEQELDDKVYKPSLVLGRISSAKNNLFSWQDYANHIELQNEDKYSGKPKLGLLFELYAKRCFKAGAMDFDDLLYNTYILLKNFPDVLNKYQNKFKYVMVDEFQDTNFAQYVILRKLSAQHENICVVGDDAQSIYAFRGANIQNILNFEKDYPDLKTFKLEQNYRSTKNIVSAANSVIANNRAQLKKEVWTDNTEGDKIKVLRAISDNEEGNAVARQIFENKMNDRLLNKDFAILYRTNAQSRSMEEALRKLNIPYRVYGGVSFFQRKEIKDLLAYFRLTINNYDEEALERIYNYPTRGIGKTTYEKLFIKADEWGATIWDVMEKISEPEIDIANNTKQKIADFVTSIKSYSILAKNQNAYEVASHIAQSSGLLRELFNDKTSEGISHYENIQELLAGIKEFTENGNAPLSAPSLEIENAEATRLLTDYMQDIALLTDAEQKDDGYNDKVSLMTVHSAKGLEFKNVFVVGLEENLFPSQLSVNSREELEEERRLFYVAITRAENKLIISYAMSRFRWGNLISCEPSRFLEEIDPKYLSAPETVMSEPKPKNNYSKNNGWKATNGYENFNESSTPVFSKNSFTKNNLKPVSKTPKPAAFKAPTDFLPDNPRDIREGMNVMHVKFGVGKVVKIEGNFPDNKATVNFQGQGDKQLLLKYARLKIVESV